MEVALQRLGASPEISPLCDERHRFYILRRCPYSIIYRVESGGHLGRGSGARSPLAELLGRASLTGNSWRINGLKGPIRYSTFNLKPNDWNGETVHLTLVDIYRVSTQLGLFAERPKVEVPTKIAGMGSYPIKAGGSLTVTTDGRKWKIVGGWVPGKYKATVRIENLAVEGDRCILSVHSEPFEFEIR